MQSKLGNDEYRNWIEVGQALLILSEILQAHASKEIKAFYDLLTVMVGTGTKCHCTSAPERHNTLSCRWAQAIMSYYRDPPKIKWRVSNSSKWDNSISGPSEVAFVYAGEQSMDGLRYLQFLRSCSYFNILEKVLNDAINVWKRLWGKALNQKIVQNEKLQAVDAITKVLHESLFRNDANTKRALKDIQSIEFWDHPRLQIAEIKVVHYYREFLENKRLKMTKDIVDLDTNLNNVESVLLNMQDPCQRASVPLQDSLVWLYYVFAAINLNFFTKHRKSQEVLLGIFRLVTLIFHYTFICIVLIVIMVLVGSVTMIFSMTTSGFIAKHV